MPKRIPGNRPNPTHRISVVAELERFHYEVSSVARVGELGDSGTDVDLVILGTSGEDPVRLVSG